MRASLQFRRQQFQRLATGSHDRQSVLRLQVQQMQIVGPTPAPKALPHRLAIRRRQNHRNPALLQAAARLSQRQGPPGTQAIFRTTRSGQQQQIGLLGPNLLNQLPQGPQRAVPKNLPPHLPQTTQPADWLIQPQVRSMHDLGTFPHALGSLNGTSVTMSAGV
jgi:hypothetical protein